MFFLKHHWLLVLSDGGPARRPARAHGTLEFAVRKKIEAFCIFLLIFGALAEATLAAGSEAGPETGPSWSRPARRFKTRHSEHLGIGYSSTSE